MRIKAIVGAVFAGGAVVVGALLGSGDKGDIGPAGPAAANMRPVRLDGECPAPHGKEPAKCEQTIQADGYCLCFTRQGLGQVDGEVSSVSARPAKDRRRLVVCGDGIGRTAARWEASDKPVAATCTLAVEDALAPEVSASGVELGDTEAKLREACAPCPVSAGNWGPCPHCLRWPGGCAAACR